MYSFVCIPVGMYANRRKGVAAMKGSCSMEVASSEAGPLFFGTSSSKPAKESRQLPLQVFRYTHKHVWNHPCT